ncbi:MAG: hypothetical protein ACJAWY_002582 [Sphingomonas echinoides]|jgi:hypothetical protein
MLHHFRHHRKPAALISVRDDPRLTGFRKRINFD